MSHLRRRSLVAFLPAVAGALLVLAPAAGGGEPAGIRSKKELCRQAQAAVAHVTPAELQGLMDSGREFLLLDIRTRAEYDAGHLDGAIWLPRGFLEFSIEEVTGEPDAEIVVYCLKGCRGSRAALTLEEMGYRNVRDLAGGLAAWLKENRPLVNQYGRIEVVEFSDEEPFTPRRN